MDKNKLLQEIEKVEQELKRRQEDVNFLQYRPRSFHYNFITSKCPVKLFVGSNQSGKTFAVCQEIIAYALGYRPWVGAFHTHVKANPTRYPWIKDPADILKHERVGRVPPTSSIVVGLDFQSAVSQVIAPKLLSIVPQDRYIAKIDYMQGKIPQKIFWKNGSTTSFMSAEQDYFRFEGVTCDLAVFDEPPPQPVWVALKRGLLVKKGVALFSMTPLSEPWIFDTLFSDAQKEGSNVHLSTCDLFSKEIDWMSQEAKEDFKKEIERKDPHEVEARIHGRFKHLMGRIFNKYSPGVHKLAKEKIDLRHDVTYGMTVDPHDRKPFFISWWFVDSLGKITFFKEWPTQPFSEMRSCDWTVAQYAEMIKEFEETLPCDVFYRLIDPNSGVRRNAITGQNFVDEFAKHGLYFDNRIRDDLQVGHEAVRDYLDYDTDEPISNTNTPKLFISEECWNIDHAMQRYVWAEKKNGSLVSEKPDEKHKDPVDVLRYTVIKRPIYIEGGSAEIWSPEVSDLRSF